jgi:hypothetical protein
MRKVREGPADLFKPMLNPLMKEFQPKEGDWKDWEAFEGVYEEAMHLLCLHILKVLNRKSGPLCGQRKINPLIHKARAEQSEAICTKQEIQRRLGNVKSVLEQLHESHENSPADRRKQTKIVAAITQFLNLIPPEARRDAFRERDLEIIWEELSISEDHRSDHPVARSEDYG